MSSCQQSTKDGTIWGYQRSAIGSFLMWIIVIFTGGIAALIFFWFPKWLLQISHRLCSLETATRVLHIDRHGNEQIHRIFIQSMGDKQDIGSKVPLSDGVIELLFFCDTVDQERFENDIPFVDRSQSYQPIRFYIDRFIKYTWNNEAKQFEKVRGLEKAPSHVFRDARGKTQAEVDNLRTLYGYNHIDVPITPIISLLLREVLSPFYVFQVFSFLVFVLNSYYIYGGALMTLSMANIIYVLYERRMTEKNLREKMVRFHETLVYRDDHPEAVLRDARELVPGDVVELPPHGYSVSCDMLLVSGRCIVDESGLTGESAAQIKMVDTSFLNDNTATLSLKKQRNFILYAGSDLLQSIGTPAHQPVKAVVLRTGFSTTRGELLRNIMFPSKMDIEFTRDATRFLAVFICLGILGMAYAIYITTYYKHPTRIVVFAALDVITIAVPPALPLVMTAGLAFAVVRLKRSEIFCTNLSAINTSGTVDIVCFDKTGTLTEDNLTLNSAIIASSVDDPSKKDKLKSYTPNQLPSSSTMATCMAVCHSLESSANGVVGDVLDQRMLETSGWVFTDAYDQKKYGEFSDVRVVCNKQSNSEAVIVRQFPFTSDTRCMSVVALKVEQNNPQTQKLLYVCKGAPERVSTFCKPNSIPSGYEDSLRLYTSTGFRVVAFAIRDISSLKGNKITDAFVQNLNQADLSQEMTFVGLALLENPLKPNSAMTIEALQKARVRSLIITGDNLLTAVFVARELKMIRPDDKLIPVGKDISDDIALISHMEKPNSDMYSGSAPMLSQLSLESSASSVSEYEDQENIVGLEREKYCITGDVWDHIKLHRRNMFTEVVKQGVVFARFSPTQKMEVIEALNESGWHTCMVGDGSNDCAALQAAHAGLALSTAEACVAGHFTSIKLCVSSVLELLKEGRCALVTAFSCFKYLILYAIIQYFSVLILYSVGTNLSDYQFLYIDIVLAPTLALASSMSAAANVLHSIPPSRKLFTFRILGEVFCQIVLCLVFQLGAFFVVRAQSWYRPYAFSESDGKKWKVMSDINSAVFYASAFQYLATATCFNKGHPYRQPIYRQYVFIVTAAIQCAMLLSLFYTPGNSVKTFMEIQEPPAEHFWAFRGIQSSLIGGYIFLAAATTAVFVLFYDMGLFSRRKSGLQDCTSL